MIYSLFYLSANHLLFSSIFSITFLSNIICLYKSAHPFSSPQTLFLIFFQRWTHTFSHPLIQSYQIAKMLLFTHTCPVTEFAVASHLNTIAQEGSVLKRSSVIIALEICAIAALFVSWSFQRPNSRQVTVGNASEHFIRWVDFDVTADAMTQAFRYDVDTCQQDLHLNWVDLLAYLGARYGGDFSHYQASDMTEAAEQLQNGVTVEELTKNMTSFAYYREAYGAVLDGMVGLYEIEIPKSEAPAFALADAQIQEGDPAANTSYATTPPTTAATTGTDTIDSASQASPKRTYSSDSP